MIRTMRLLDTTRLLRSDGLRGRNWAETRERLIGQEGGDLSPLKLLRKGLASHHRGAIWVQEEEGSLCGIVSGRVRSISRVWEVDLLCLAPRQEEGCQELLEAVAAYAGRRGGQRVILRLPVESPFLAQVRRAGFVPCVRETLYHTDRCPSIPLPTSPSLRKRQPSDDYPLFRLYNAAVPSQVRATQAMTLDQWQDFEWALARRGSASGSPSPQGARWGILLQKAVGLLQQVEEQLPGSREELLWEAEGSVVAWLYLQIQGSRTIGELLMHPHWEGYLSPLLNQALGRLAGRRVSWLVPEYQESLARHLEEQSFTAAGEYVVLVKSLVARVLQRAAVPARA